MNILIAVCVVLMFIAWILIAQVKSYFRDEIPDAKFYRLPGIVKKYPDLAKNLSTFADDGGVTELEYEEICLEFDRREAQSERMIAKQQRQDALKGYTDTR